MEINQAWIDEQRALCDAATPGPWEHCGNDVYSTVNQRLGMVLMSAFENPITDTNFAAAARTAMPAALDALEAARKEIARLTAERDAAARDLKWLSNEYKFCVTCKRDNGRGVWDCNDERCNAENHYEWRGLCSSNTDAPAGAESD